MEQNAFEWTGHGDSAGSGLASTLGRSFVSHNFKGHGSRLRPRQVNADA